MNRFLTLFFGCIFISAFSLLVRNACKNRSIDSSEQLNMNCFEVGWNLGMKASLEIEQQKLLGNKQNFQLVKESKWKRDSAMFYKQYIKDE